MQIKLKPVSTIKSSLGIQQYGPAHKYFADRCKNYMNAKYVPEKNGPLVNTSFVDNQCNIVYPQEYAHYQYKGKLYVDPITNKGAFFSEDYGYWSRPKSQGIPKVPTDTNLNYTKAGTGPYWDKRMVSAEMQKIEKEMEIYIKRGCK